MIDLNQPPKNWLFVDDTQTHCDRHHCASLERAHQIAAEEAQPHVDHALERILLWLEDNFYDEWFAYNHEDGHNPATADAFIAYQIRQIMNKERPLP